MQKVVVDAVIAAGHTHERLELCYHILSWEDGAQLNI